MIYLTSDLHIFHTNVIRYCNRPFNTVEEMNEALVANWNFVVDVDDSVYCLGDFSMAARPVETFTKRLNGIKYLVPGNHDFCHSYHKKSRTPENRAKWIKFYQDNGWIVLPEQTTLEVPGLGTLNMCHMPYESYNSGSDEKQFDDKYKKWRPVDDGRILLCGHVHEKWKTKKTDKETLMINVGVDVNNHKPVSLDQIAELIKKEQV